MCRSCRQEAAARQQDTAERGMKAVCQQDMREDERRDTMRHYTVL